MHVVSNTIFNYITDFHTPLEHLHTRLSVDEYIFIIKYKEILVGYLFLDLSSPRYLLLI